MQNKASRGGQTVNLKHSVSIGSPASGGRVAVYSVFSRRRTLLASTNASGFLPPGRWGIYLNSRSCRKQKRSPANVTSPFLERRSVSRTPNGSLPISALANVHDPHGSLSGSGRVRRSWQIVLFSFRSSSCQADLTCFSDILITSIFTVTPFTV